MGEYIPQAPINDDAKKNNKNLPGMGGVFNVINMHTYAYTHNNPIKLVDPDGRAAGDDVPGLIPADCNKDNTSGDFNVDYTDTASVYTHHEGVDWAVPIGTDVVAQREMKVVYVRDTDAAPGTGYGKYVILQDVEKPELFYLGAHMDTITVTVDDVVKAGETVGTSGDTGAGGAHFHTSTSIISSGNYSDYRYSNNNIRADKMVNPYDHTVTWEGKVK